MAVQTYSLLDVIFTFTHPVAGSFTANGNQGVGRIVITYSNDRTVMALAGDGGVMGTAKPGRMGSISIEVQQTSALHGFLLGWFNYLDAQMLQSDVSTWFSAVVEVRSITTGRFHVLQGVAPQKITDQTYEGDGQNYTWSLPAADVQTT